MICLFYKYSIEMISDFLTCLSALPTTFVQIHSLVSINVQQALMNVSGYNFFSHSHEGI